MSVNEPFFKRRQRERGEFPELFQTERMPHKLQLQLFEIYRDIVGASGDFSGNGVTTCVLDVLRREHPEDFMNFANNYEFINSVLKSVGNLENDEYILSIIEISIQIHPHIHQREEGGSYYFEKYRTNRPPLVLEDYIDEINIRMKENGYGYQFEEGQFIPIDSTATHQEAVKPAIILMKNESFHGALDEFMSAFDGYKSGRFEECIRLCGNSIESTLKQIIAERGLMLPKSQTATPMIELLSSNDVVPAYLTSHYTSLFSMLKSGVPTVRNNSGGHGAGVQPRDVPDYLARFVINMTASSILFLIHAHQDTK